MDLSVNLGGLKMATPLTVASGTFGYGTEYVGALDYLSLGAVTVKGIRLDPWPGNPMPRHVEVPGGLLNAIGLQGPGVKYFLDYHVPHYLETVSEALGSRDDVPPLIVNVWGGSEEEYAQVAACISEAARTGLPIGALEMNVSCPNVKEGGHTFGQSPHVLERVAKGVRAVTHLPLIVKLAPNVPSLAPYVHACEEAQVDALALINTIPAMVIDVETRRSVLGNVTGGLSGRAVHPVAVKAVWDAHRLTSLPILAMGGVYEARDAIEFMLAGATAVAIGTANFTNPNAAHEILQGMVAYCQRQGLDRISALTGYLAK